MATTYIYMESSKSKSKNIQRLIDMYEEIIKNNTSCISHCCIIKQEPIKITNKLNTVDLNISEDNKQEDTKPEEENNPKEINQEVIKPPKKKRKKQKINLI